MPMRINERLSFKPALSVLLLLIAVLAAITANLAKAHSKVEADFFDALFRFKPTVIEYDAYGFLWFGTQNGLFRFDGNQFLVVNHDVVTTASIEAVTSVGTDKIAVAVNGKIYTFNAYDLSPSQTFAIPCADASDCRTLDLNYKNACLWIANYSGLFSIGVNKNDEDSECPNDRRSTPVIEKPIYGLEKFHKRQVIAIASDGLFVIDQDNFKVHTPEIFMAQKHQAKRYYSVRYDGSDNVWLGGEGAIYRWRLDSGEINSVSHPQLKSRVWSISLTNAGALFFGTFSDGVFTKSPKTASIEKREVLDAFGNPRQIRQVLSTAVDNAGSVWAVTGTGAFFRISHENLNIKYLNTHSDDQDQLIYAVSATPQKNKLYYAVLGEGIYSRTLTNSKENGRLAEPSASSHHALITEQLKDKNVASLLVDSKGHLWIGSFAGLTVFSLDKNQIIFDNTQQQGSLSTINLLEDSRGNVWIGGNRQLGYFKKGKFSEFINLAMQEVEFFNGFAEYENGLVIGTNSGVLYFNFENETLSRIDLISQGKIITPWVTALESQKDSLLIASKNGVFEARLADNSLSDLRELELVQLLEHAYTVGLAANKDSYIFMTKTGLYHFDKTNKRFDQVNQVEYNFGATSFTGADQRLKIYAGTRFGLSEIDWLPQAQPQMAHLKISALKINGQRVDWRGYMVKGPEPAGSISLPADTASVEIGFVRNFYQDRFSGALEFFHNGEKVQGAAGQWSVLLSGIEPGQSVLSVKHNSHGDINRKIYFHKAIPFWQTALGRLVLLAIVFMGLVLLYYLVASFRHRHIVRKNRQLSLLIEEKTQDLVSKNRKIEEQAEHLKKLLRVKDEFFLNVTHDLKTPLSLILYPLSLLKASVKETDEAKLVEIAETNGARLLRDINQLLDIDRLEFEQQWKRSCYDLGDLVNFYYPLFQDNFNKSGISLQVNTQRCVIVACDQWLFEKIFSNLLSNVLKYAPEGAECSIEVYSKADTAHLCISNTGSFIPADKYDVVFEKFTRLGEHQYSPGSGVGLYLVREMIQALSGSVVLRSSESEGTSFTITFPLVTNADEVNSINHATAATVTEVHAAHKVSFEGTATGDSSASEKSKILIVEDNVELANCLCMGLRELYEVRLASSAEDGIKMATQCEPDLVVTDLKMSGLTGFDLCHALKSKPSTVHIPIIVLTANADQENKLRAWGELADAFMEKPFEWRDLCARIESLIEARKRLIKKLSLDYFSSSDDVNNAEDIPSSTKAKLKKLKDIVASRYSDEDFSAEEMAELMGTSKRNISRLVKDLLDTSPMELVKTYRLEQAKKFLLEGAPVIVVADKVGIKSHAHFSRLFKERFQQSPSDFRKSKQQ